MRLIKLELNDDFRSLKNGFKINFLSDFDDVSDINSFDPYCIVGQNGSGKSNVLEVLSAIFYQLELEYLNFLPKKIEKNEDADIDEEELEIFLSNKRKPNAYILEYYIKAHASTTVEFIHVHIEKKEDEQAKVYIEKDFEKELSKLEAKEYLPEYIVGYSSGDNEILSLPFLKMRMIQYDEYINFLRQDTPYPNDAPESRMIYLDDTFSQAIFITNFLFPDATVHKIFLDTLGIEKVEEFRIIIKQDIEIYDVLGKKLRLAESIQSKIYNLKNCATTYYEDQETDQLILDFYVDDICRETFKKFFGSRLELFKLFQILITMNYYQTTEQTKEKLYNSPSLYAKGFLPNLPWDERFFTFKNFWIEKENIDARVLTRSLSDGEHQFLHSIGLSLLYKNTSSLFLLDEPETHFNPAWRANYISTLRECFKGDEVSPEILITSHSPFIVSDSKPEKVLVFEKNEHNKVTCERPGFNTFGASINKITMNIFEKRETIGEYAGQIIDNFKERMETTDDLESLFSELDETIGDSIEKTLFMKELFDRIEKK